VSLLPKDLTHTQWSFVADLLVETTDLATLESVTNIADGGNRAVSIQNGWTTPGHYINAKNCNGLNEINYVNSTDI
jgi:hypothetical protein